MLGFILAVVLTVVAVNLFAHELESVSASRAKKKGTRSLDLGLSGRAVLSAVGIIVLIFLALISRFETFCMVVLLILSIAISVAHYKLRVNGFATFWSWFLFSFASNIAGMVKSTASVSSPAMIIWSVFIAIPIIAMIITHLMFKLEKDDKKEDAGPSFGNFFKVILVIIALVAFFIAGYMITSSLIVPHLS